MPVAAESSRLELELAFILFYITLFSSKPACADREVMAYYT
jgi:hypothetical protein